MCKYSVNTYHGPTICTLVEGVRGAISKNNSKIPVLIELNGSKSKLCYLPQWRASGKKKSNEKVKNRMD